MSVTGVIVAQIEEECTPKVQDLPPCYKKEGVESKGGFKANGNRDVRRGSGDQHGIESPV